jgi:hypothetical protein
MSHLLIHLKKPNVYSIIKDTHGKLRNSSKAQICNEDTNNQWCTGVIVYRGSEKECFKIANKDFSELYRTETEDEQYRPFDPTPLYPSMYFLS